MLSRAIQDMLRLCEEEGALLKEAIVNIDLINADYSWLALRAETMVPGPSEEKNGQCG